MATATFAIRRTNPRFPFSADAEITLRDGNGLCAKLSELSSRGCYIDTLEPVPVGTEMHISIRDGVLSCDVDGRVIYEHTGSGFGVFGMGVLFADMGAQQHNTIGAWLIQLAALHAKRSESDYEPHPTV
ncbi:MAG: PilZ domain-containing protein [Candidatus Acidiferrales bacterium]